MTSDRATLSREACGIGLAEQMNPPAERVKKAEDENSDRTTLQQLSSMRPGMHHTRLEVDCELNLRTPDHLTVRH
jgi:hypothetical protein